MASWLSSDVLLDRYKSAPNWLKSFIILSLIYLSFKVWSKIVRTRRELQVASWILSERRRAGIPDSDKRPFKIAKAAVEATKKHSSTTSHLSPPPPPPPLSSSSSSPSPSSPPPLPRSSSSVLPPRTSRPKSSTSLDRPPQTSNLKSPTHESSDHPSYISQPTFEPVSNSESNLPSRTAIPPSSSKSTNSPQVSPKPDSDPLLTPNRIDRSNQKREAPLSTDGSDPERSEGEVERLTSRNRKKIKTKNETLSNDIPVSDQHSGLSTPNETLHDQLASKANDDQLEQIPLRKKRILSDCVGEADSDQASRVKKGRSGKETDPHPTSTTPDESARVEEFMQIDQGDDEAGELGDDQTPSDHEVYIIADDGKKKKLVKIRLKSPESNQSAEESAAEQRWVTRREFSDLKQHGKLLLDGDQWDSSSTSSNDSFESQPNQLSTPSKQTASLPSERGPIWSIERKPLSNSKLPTSEISMTIRSVSRPRNSLGRMRLSLPPDPGSPLQRARSRIISPLRPAAA